MSDQPSDIYDQHAVKLMQMGYHPVPVAPLGFEIQKCPVRWDPHTKQFFKFKSWNTLPPVIDSQPGANIGALMGGTVVGLDFDHDDAALIISEVFPPSPVNKVGERGWTAFYRIDTAVPCEDFYNGDGELVLQILGAGKQTILPPSIHPTTKQPYRWTNGHSLYDTPVEELPLLPADYRERILKLGFSTTRPGRERPKPDKRLNNSDQGEPDGPFGELNQVAIHDLAKWVPQLNIYKLRRRVGRFANYEGVAQWRESTTGKKLEDRSLNLKISGLGIKDFGDGRGYSALDLVMAARSSSLGEAFCWLEEKLLPPKEDIEIDLDKIMEAQDAPATAADDETENTSSDQGGQPDDIYPLTPYRLKDENQTKPRPWVAYKHYMLGTVSSTVAPGAVGKTSNNLVEACGMALGRDLFTGRTFKRRYRVWYHSAEETPEEMDLRLAAIAKRYGFSHDDLGDWLFVTCGFDVEIKASTRGKNPTLNIPTRNKIIRTIKEKKIEIAVFDPLAAMHSMPEKDNIAMAELIYDFFGPIAYQTKAAIEIVHHTRKGPPGTEIEYTAADWRGGSASTFALRGVRVCNVMKKSEAEAFEIEEIDRLSYFRITRGKNNMTRMGDVGWRQFVTVTLQNGNPETGDENEEVGVVIAYTPPTDVNLALYSQEDKDHWRKLVTADNAYGVHPNSKQWFGCEIAKRRAD